MCGHYSSVLLMYIHTYVLAEYALSYMCDTTKYHSEMCVFTNFFKGGDKV